MMGVASLRASPTTYRIRFSPGATDTRKKSPSDNRLGASVRLGLLYGASWALVLGSSRLPAHKKNGYIQLRPTNLPYATRLI